MIANILNVTVEVPKSEEGPSMGAAMLAAVACGEYDSVQAAADAIVTVREVIEPEPELVEKYEARYQTFREIYPVLRPLFQKLD